MARPRRGVARFAASIMVSLLLHGTTMAAGGTRAPFDDGWKFIRAESPLAPVLFSTRAEVERAPDEDRAVCTNVTQLPIGTATMHLRHATAATSITACKQACCDDSTCETAQWCGPAGCGRDSSGKPSDQNNCWMGLLSNTRKSAGWQSFDMGRGHSPAPEPGPHPSPSPSPPEHPAHPAFALTNFDDSGWTEIDTPHDWMIHDLPLREQDMEMPVLGPRYGMWQFSPWHEANGSDAGWSDPSFNDSKWQAVRGGVDWRVSSGYNDTNATGWYRQKVTVPDYFLNASGLILSLGVIAGADEVWVNGVKVGQTDSYPPQIKTYETFRRYPLAIGGVTGNPCSCSKPRQPCAEPGRTFCPTNHAPGQCSSPCTNATPGEAPKTVLTTGENLIAIRVQSKGGSWPGGLYDDPILQDVDVRSGPFDAGASPGGRATGYTVGKVGWYRKNFTVSSFDKEAKTLIIYFEGVYENSDVYVNGHHLGMHPYGYTSFYYIMPSDVLIVGSSNVVAVRTENVGKNSRWYSGSGIFRHVHLYTLPRTFIGVWGTSVRPFNVKTTGDSAVSASIEVNVTATNTRTAPTTATVSVQLLDENGVARGPSAQSNTVAVPASSSNTTITIIVSMTLAKGEMWSTEIPTLFSANVTLKSGDDEDTVTEKFGVRTLSFTTAGFFLNNVSTKLRGGAIHHDNGPLGSAAIDRAEERRIEILKRNGYNAIRTSHNPVSPALLSACDKHGMLVMDEFFDFWSQGKNSDDYHQYFNNWWQRDVTNTVLRDRNHPSVIIWSIGNEIPGVTSPQGASQSKALAELVRQVDPGSGRAITSATVGASNKADAEMAPLDVCGYNYAIDGTKPDSLQSNVMLKDHTRLPDRVMMETESCATVSAGVWNFVNDNDFVLGDFIWTAWDYIGESGIGHETQTGDIDEQPDKQGGLEPFPFHLGFCGDIDIIGHQKPQAYFRRVLWNNSKLEMGVHRPIPLGKKEIVGPWGWPEELQSWTWPTVASGSNMSLRVFSQLAPFVTVLLNDKTVATGSINSTTLVVAFEVPYTPGNLTVHSFTSADAQLEHTMSGLGTPFASRTFLTAGVPTALQLTADRSSIRNSRNDLSYITLQVIDAKGTPVPEAAVEVNFTIAGPGEIAAVGNGNPRDVSSFYQSTRRTWQGKALAIIRPAGTGAVGSITLSAMTEGLPKATVIVTAT